MMKFLLATALLAALGSANAALPKVTLSKVRDSGHRVFVDENDREVLFHGINSIVKGPPWVPDTTTFSTGKFGML